MEAAELGDAGPVDDQLADHVHQRVELLDVNADGRLQCLDALRRGRDLASLVRAISRDRSCRRWRRGVVGDRVGIERRRVNRRDLLELLDSCLDVRCQLVGCEQDFEEICDVLLLDIRL